MSNKILNKGAVNVKTLVIAAIVVVIIIALLYIFRGAEETPVEEIKPTIVETPQAIAIPETAPLEVIEEMLEESDSAYVIDEDLPSLADSDSVLRDLLTDNMGDKTLLLLSGSSLIQKIILQIENIAAGKIIYRHSPIKAPNKPFAVTGEGESVLLDKKSYQRYNRYVDILSKADPEKMAALYRFFQPLLEQAYADLGHSPEDFHPRFLQAIEHISKAPILVGDIRLNRPSVMYHFADQKLEKMSMVHKQMIRVGPKNLLKIKSALNRFQQQL